MSAEEEVPQSHLDAKLITDLRSMWAELYNEGRHGDIVTITPEEMDALLRAVDQRDRLLDEMCSMPDEAQAAPVQAVDIPAGHAVIGGVVTPLPGSFDPGPAAVRTNVCTCRRTVRDARYRYGVRHEKSCLLYHEPESGA